MKALIFKIQKRFFATALMLGVFGAVSLAAQNATYRINNPAALETNQVVINANWDFYWGKFVAPTDMQTVPEAQVEVPLAWNKYDLSPEINAVTKKGKGSATYRLLLTNLEPNKEYAFPTYELCYTAFTVLCGQKVVYRSGDPSLDWIKTKAEQNFDKAVFTADSEGNALLTFYVSNNFYRKGGFRGAFQLSEASYYEKLYNKKLCIYSIFAGILLIMTIYCLLMGLYKKEKTSLYLALLVFGIITRVITSVFPLLKGLFASIPFTLMLRIEYLALLLIPSAQILYFDSLNKKIFHHIPVKLLAMPALVLFVLDFCLPISIANRLVPVMQAYMFAIIVLSLVLFFIRIIKDKDFISLMAVISLIIIAIGATNDILLNNQKTYLGSVRLLGLSFVVYAFFQIVVLAYVQDRNYRKVVELNEDLAITNKAYYRFVPKEILELLGHENVIEAAPGDYKVLKMGLLSADVRNFTSTSEKMPAFQVFELLNIYLQRVAPFIRKNGGIIEKYLGDGIVAIFPEGAACALTCAVEMQNEMNKLRQELVLKGFPAIKIGVGVHYGNVVIGTGGNLKRMSEVSLSDDINIVINTEAATKSYEKPILATAAAVMHAEKELAEQEVPQEQNEIISQFQKLEEVKGLFFFEEPVV